MCPSAKSKYVYGVPRIVAVRDKSVPFQYSLFHAMPEAGIDDGNAIHIPNAFIYIYMAVI